MLTLLEAVKLNPGDAVRAGIVTTYAQTTDILRVLPFETISGNAYRYNQEQTLPGTGFREVNGAFTESTGVVNPLTEPLVIAGGDLDVDRFIIQTNGMNVRSSHEAMKTKSLAHSWGHSFIAGDITTTPAGLQGLQARCTGDRLIENGSTDGGDPLSLAKLDEAIDNVVNPTHIIMNRTMRRRMTIAARTAAVGGNIEFTKDEFGRQLVTYADLPILLADRLTDVNQTLAFNELGATGSTATATSIYVISVGPDGVFGIQNGEISVRDLGELDDKPVWRTRVEWYAGFVILGKFAACRLRGIKNAAVVA